VGEGEGGGRKDTGEVPGVQVSEAVLRAGKF